MKELPKKSAYDIDYDLIDRLFPREGSVVTQPKKSVANQAKDKKQ